MSVASRTESLEPVIAQASAPSGRPAIEDESIRAELAELANRMRNRDHYGVLDVPSTATDEEVRIAFACLSKRTHPDRFNGASHSVRQLAEQVFARVVEAEDYDLVGELV